MFINRRDKFDECEVRKKEPHKGISAVNMVVGAIVTLSLIVAVAFVSWISLQSNTEKLAKGPLGWIVIGLGLAEPEVVEATEDTSLDYIIVDEDWQGPKAPLASTPDTELYVPDLPPIEEPTHSQPESYSTRKSYTDTNGGEKKLTVEEAEANLLYAEADLIGAKIDLFRAQHPDYEETEYEEYDELLDEYLDKVSEIFGDDPTNPTPKPSPYPHP